MDNIQHVTVNTFINTKRNSEIVGAGASEDIDSDFSLPKTIVSQSESNVDKKNINNGYIPTL
eukprot:UN13530